MVSNGLSRASYEMLYGSVPPVADASSAPDTTPSSTPPNQTALTAEQYEILFGETPPLPTEVLSGWTNPAPQPKKPHRPSKQDRSSNRQRRRQWVRIPGGNALVAATGTVVTSIREHPGLSIAVLVVSLGAGIQLAASSADTPPASLAAEFVEVEVESSRILRTSSTQAPTITVAPTSTTAPTSAPPTTVAPTSAPPTTASPATSALDSAPATTVPPTTAVATTVAPTTTDVVDTVTPIVDVPVTGSIACHPSYDPCIPDLGTDVDCRNSQQDGPRFSGPVVVSGTDDYDLDPDGDGFGCAGT